MAISDDILDLSKIEAGKIEITEQVFSLRQLLKAIELSVRPSAEKTHVSLRVKIAKSCPDLLRGDPLRLRQVVYNLLQNAVKFTAIGTIKLEVTSKPCGNQQQLRFEIEDTGIGIEAHVIGKIWESFEQADASITRRFGGTGLGLAICAQLVGLMGGKIGVQSQVGAGSRFWFELKMHDAKGQKGRPCLKSGGLKPTPMQALKILVAEDHLINQRVITHIVEKLGHRCEVVAHGKEVLASLAKSRFDLILMDCHMPELDGYATAREIRRHSLESVRKIPIIAVTADVLGETRQQCLAAGMNGYISKPIDLEQLRLAIDRFARPPSPSPLDLSMLERLSALNDPGESDFLKELVADYLKDTSQKLNVIKLAGENNHRQRVAENCHSLKSASATLGAHRFAEALAKLEMSASKNSALESLEHEIESLFELFNEAATALKKAV
jgi:CheY-like chemotaxis protein/HPt (histidine-containing phosphotransfer) domain-containing protein